MSGLTAHTMFVWGIGGRVAVVAHELEHLHLLAADFRSRAKTAETSIARILEEIADDLEEDANRGVTASPGS